MKYSVIALALAATSLTSPVFAGFILQDAKVLGSEDGAMGKHQPYEAPADASFRAPDGSAKSSQERYKNAQLVVDLAYTAVTQRGTGIAPVFDGFGDDLSLSTAMSMIMPSGWRFYQDNSVDAKAVPEKVSYPGGKPWPEVLKQIGDRYALHFQIDWYDHTVLMTKGRPGMGMQARPAKVIQEPNTPPIMVASSGAVVSIPSPLGAQPIKTVGGAVVMPTSAVPAVVTVGESSSKGSIAPGVKPTTASQQKPVVASSSLAAKAGTGSLAPVTPVVAKVEPVKAYVPPAPVVPMIPTWNVSTKDRTIREALKSWTVVAGWTFEPEHWAVPVDLPLTAGASFRGDFKSAVRQLIATSELSDTPVQPCFYLNKVVRVVPINVSCDPTGAR